MSTPPSNTWFPGPTGLSIANRISISTAVFAQIMTESPYSLQQAVVFPLKIAHSRGDLDPI